MNRREFLHTTAFGLAVAALSPAQEFDRDVPEGKAMLDAARRNSRVTTSQF